MTFARLPGDFRPAPPDGRRGEALLDAALHALSAEGLSFEDPEALALLRSADALASPPAERARLRARLVRRVLSEAPAAFNLHDRSGAKAFTLAGGAETRGAPARWDGADCVTLEAAAEADASMPADTPPSLAEVVRLHEALLREDRPLYLAGGRAESIDALRGLLEVLRGSASAAEEKPFAIFQVEIATGGSLAGPACRMLVAAARRAIPTALALSLPAARTLSVPDAAAPRGASAARGGALAAAVPTLAATMIHQLARRQAPVAWTLRMASGDEATADHWRAWSDLFALAERLELPALAMIPGSPREPGPAAAATAALACGARAILFDAGAGSGAKGAAAGPSRAEPSSFLRGPTRRESSQRIELRPELRAALLQVVRNEAARCGVEVPGLDAGERGV